MQWFSNFFNVRTTLNNLVVREAQDIALYGDSRNTSANLADHLWSAEQTLRNTGLMESIESKKPLIRITFEFFPMKVMNDITKTLKINDLILKFVILVRESYVYR